MAQKLLNVITNHQKNANQNHNDMSHTCQNDWHQKEHNILVRIWRKGNSMYISGGNVNWYSHYRKQYGGS